MPILILFQQNFIQKYLLVTEKVELIFVDMVDVGFVITQSISIFDLVEPNN